MKQTWTQKLGEWWDGLSSGGRTATMGIGVILILVVAANVHSCVAG